MSATTIYRKDYQPYPFMIHQVDLNFDLYDDHAMVENTMQLERVAAGALKLDGDDLELVEVLLDGDLLAPEHFQLTDKALILPDCPEKFTLKIITRIRPQDNTKLSGLYRSNHLFCTQCEAEGFRRITFFPDRPDVLSVYTTRISAEKARYPILLSNGNLIESGEAKNGRHWTLWQDPFKKPSYLFALVAGDLVCLSDQFITCSGRTIDLRIYVEPGEEHKCTHAMHSLKRAMKWDEDTYGREYDLELFMIVAVSDFNMGAMENKGLNIFNSKYILARPETATDTDYMDIEGVVGHEYFHNWTGNRVTCRDWFQLSLKEGLTVFRDQEFSRDMNSRDVNRILDVKVLRNAQFPEDAGSMAHPVRPESYQEIDNFYTATVYNKGAEVIRMQETLLGKAGFRQGMDLYFNRYDGQAVTIDDFVGAMEDANGVDLTQFKRWYSQAGTPEIEVKSSFKNDTLELTLTQHCRPTAECQEKLPFHIPISMALFVDKKRAPVAHELIELKETTQTFRFSNLKEKPLVSLLRGFSAPVLIKQSLTQDELIDLLQLEEDGFAKWNASQSLAIGFLKQFYHAKPSTWRLGHEYIETLGLLLEDTTIDQALCAELLLPPGFADVVLHLSKVDVSLLEAARDALRIQIGQPLFSKFKATYEHLWSVEDHTMQSVAFGRRRLRNVCLWFMMKAYEEESLVLCLQQFNQAQTMTDQMASFSGLINASEDEIRDKAITSFYQQWQNDELVLDKWFSLQATCEQPDTLKRVEQLMSHPAFSLKNPNKVRALIGAFTQANPRHFHAADGSGYAFLSDAILKIDPINPKIASRLATPFTRWHAFDEARQRLIQEQLSLLAAEDLSDDLREMVTKSLESA